jgi:hypothetical protein
MPPTFLLVFFGLPLWLVASAIWIGTRRRGKRLRGTFLPLAALALAIAGTVAYLWKFQGLELNPTIPEPQLAGSWRTGERVLTLDQHGAYRKSGAWSGSGICHRSDFVLQCGEDELRPVLSRGELRLLLNPPDDMDEWNGDLGFRREGAVSQAAPSR